MQNTNSTATAPTKRGLKLKQEDFRYAIEKALTLKPRVNYVSLSASIAETESGKGFVRVNFTTHEDGLWVSCACQEDFSNRNRNDHPRACFHAAAAAIDRNLFQVPQPIGAQVEAKILDSLAYDAVKKTEARQAVQERFRPRIEEPAWDVDENDYEEFPQLVRERKTISYDLRQVRRQAEQIKAETGWDM